MGSALCRVNSTTHLVQKFCEPNSCYDPLRARCDTSTVVKLPTNINPVHLKVVNSSNGLEGKYLQAANGQIQIGGRGTDVPCPQSLTPDECPESKNTAFQDDGQGLSVKVDGGQEIYITTNGSMAFIKANATGTPSDVRYVMSVILERNF